MKSMLFPALIFLALILTSCGKQGGKVLYYYSPMDPKIQSDKPMKDSMGMDYVPVYASNDSGAGKKTEAKKNNGKALYVCPMHPQVHSDKPGKCSICGMDLVLQDEAGSSKKEEPAVLYYTCPMHPQVQSAKPGKCQICGMDLVPVESSGKGSATMSVDLDTHAAVEISTVKRQQIGITTETVKILPLEKMIRTPGMMSHDTELYNLQQQYISVYRNYAERMKSGEGDSLKGVIQSLEYKLVQMGLSRAQINDLGYMKESDLSLILQGRKAWVNAQIYESDIVFVRSGLSADVTFPSNPGKTYRGTIYSVTTSLDTDTRSFKARIILSDYDGRVGHESYANVVVKVPMGRKLALPEDAVIDTGIRRIVFVDKDGATLEPREVTLGEKIGEYYVVLSGVFENEKVATSANFLLDSDSQLRAVIKKASR